MAAARVHGSNSSELSAALEDACVDKDVSKMRSLLEDAASSGVPEQSLAHAVNRSDGSGWAPLLRVLRVAHPANLDLVQLLLEHGANPNGVSAMLPRCCRTVPLPLALCTEQWEAAERLLAHGADANYVEPHADKDKDKRRSSAGVQAWQPGRLYPGDSLLGHAAVIALYPSARSAGLRMCGVLLEHGADPNARCTGTYGCASPPLHMAVSNLCLPLVQLLLRHKASVHATSSYKASSALHLAVMQPGADARPGGWPAEAHPFVSKAARAGVAEALLAAGASVHALDKDGFTPLHHACKACFPAVVALLLRHGADASRAGKDGVQPLHVAAQSLDVESARLLLAAGADASGCSAQGCSPLYALSLSPCYASRLSFVGPLVELLVQHGADPNQPNLEGHGALHEACRMAHLDAVRCLIKQGADVNATHAPANIFPLYHAVEPLWGDPSVYDRPGSVHASEQERQAVVEALLAAGADPSAKACKQSRCRGQTPLQVACYRGFRGIATALLAAGADARARDAQDVTPLHGAMYGSDPIPMLRLLVRTCGQGVLHDRCAALACHGHGQDRPVVGMAMMLGKAHVAIELLSLGAPADEAAGPCQQTPLQIVCSICMDLGLAGRRGGGSGAPEAVSAGTTTAQLPVRKQAGRGAGKGDAGAGAAGSAPGPGSGSGGSGACVGEGWRGLTEERALPVVQMLLQRGADPDRYCKVGMAGPAGSQQKHLTPLYMAAMGGCQRIVDALLQAGADPMRGHLETNKPAVYEVASVGTTEMLRCLLRSGKVDVNAQHAQYGHVLHFAVCNGRVDCVEALIELHADLSVRRDGLTLTDYASRELAACTAPRATALDRQCAEGIRRIQPLLAAAIKQQLAAKAKAKAKAKAVAGQAQAQGSAAPQSGLAPAQPILQRAADRPTGQSPSSTAASANAAAACGAGLGSQPGAEGPDAAQAAPPAGPARERAPRACSRCGALEGSSKAAADSGSGSSAPSLAAPPAEAAGAGAGAEALRSGGACEAAPSPSSSPAAAALVQLKPCSACRCVRYCSVACQRADWLGGHKHACRGLQDAKAAGAAGSSV